MLSNDRCKAHRRLLAGLSLVPVRLSIRSKMFRGLYFADVKDLGPFRENTTSEVCNPRRAHGAFFRGK